jgi:hypothetical protein
VGTFRYIRITPWIAAGAVVVGPVRDLCPVVYPQAFASLSPAYLDFSPSHGQAGSGYLASGANSISSTGDLTRAFGTLTIAGEKLPL